MHEIRLAAFAHLSAMRLFGKLVCLAYQFAALGMSFAHARKHFFKRHTFVGNIGKQIRTPCISKACYAAKTLLVAFNIHALFFIIFLIKFQDLLRIAFP